MRKRRSFRQGVYTPIHKHKYRAMGKPHYRSSWELKFFQWCDNNENVLEWTSESVIIPYINPFDKKAHRYYVDNKVIIKEGDKVAKYLIEIKPDKQTKKPVTKRSTKKKSTILYENYTYVINQCKWEAAKKWCDKHGYKFLILTEKELF